MSVEIYEGVLFIHPCYKCDRYAECLESDGEEVDEHLLAKLLFFAIARLNGFKIVTSEEEWLKESKRLVGTTVHGLLLGYPKLDCTLADGMTIAVGKKDGQKIIFIKSSETVVTGKGFCRLSEKCRIEKKGRTYGDRSQGLG